MLQVFSFSPSIPPSSLAVFSIAFATGSSFAIPVCVAPPYHNDIDGVSF